MAEIRDLAVLAANNTARFPEGQLVPTLNNGARELEAIIARWNKDTNGSITSSGSSTAYAILTNQVVPAHAAGNTFMFRAHVANTGASTITINALAAKPLRRQGGGALEADDIATNQMVMIIYNSAADRYECVGISESTGGGGGGGGIENVVEDASPQLGGNLDLNSNDITGTGDINITGTAAVSGAATLGSIELGHASDTTVARASAGRISVEGVNVPTISSTDTLTNKSIDLTSNTLVGSVSEFNAALESADFYTTGGTDVALADGGTGASLSDPGADRVMFWDDSAGAVTWLTVGTGLAITNTTIEATGGGGGGIGSVVEDTSPQLGGDLDLNGQDITGTGDINITGTAAVSGAATVGSIELGHASDTTLSRASAGRLAVEGVNVVTVSSTDTLTNKTLTSPTMTAPVLGTPASGTLTNATGLPIATGVSGLGTGVATALAVNVGSAGAPVVNGGALGTPSSGTLTNATGLPIASGVSGLGTGIATALGVNTGSAGAPALVNGALGTPSSGTLANCTGLPPSGISGLAASVVANFSGGGSAITTGLKGFVVVPYAMTITSATLLADQTGSIVVDVWKDTYANAPPTDADSITASAPPTLSSAVKSQDSTLSGWTTSVSAGDVLAFNVDSVSTVTQVTLILRGTRA